MTVSLTIPTATPATAAAIMARSGAHIHLIGICGSGLSPIATILLARGYRVSGSDQAPTRVTEALRVAGATIYTGHAAGQADGADLVLISSAVPASNPELSAALAAGVPVVKRAQFLGTLMAERIGVAIAGTHGKTTTTAMIATTLLAAGRDPDFIVGGIVPGLESGAHAGHGDAFVIEADEFDRMFVGLCPQIAIMTNVEWDHVDCYPTAHDFAEAFAAFADRLPADGLLIACADDAGALQIARRRQKSELPVVTYAIDCEASWQAGDLRVNADGGSDFAAWHEGQRMADVSLRIPGRHNVSNALAALAAACTLGVPPEITVANLKDFAGVRRRFEVKGMCRDIIVIDDYAHHPREVQATLAAARQRYPQHGIWALFQPHTYSRTRALLADFEDSFADADHVLVTDIYASRERDTLGMHASQLAAMVAHKHPDARYIGDLDHAVAYLLENLRPGDVLLTLGAGDGNTVGERVLAAL